MSDGTQCSLERDRHLEALNCDLDVPCPLQWRLLWFFSPSRLNQRFTNDDGTNIAKYHEAVNMAIEITFKMPFEGLHTPRTVLLTSVGVILYRGESLNAGQDRYS